MILETFCSGPCETNGYLVGCPVTKKAFFVDAPPGIAPLFSDAVKKHGLQPEVLFLTHSHWDHIGDAAKLKSLFPLSIRIHPLDAPNLVKPGEDGLPLFFPITGTKPDEFLQEGETQTIGTLTIEILHVPGHSPGGICLYLPKEKLLFSGDTLFEGTMGRCDFPSSDLKAMFASLKKLYTLPPETQVFPGHGSPTSIRKESWIARPQDKFG